MKLGFKKLCQRLDYTFADWDLLACALTHRSAGDRNNERLEFLGDALLGCVIAEVLFAKFPRADEGQLSRLRASLVRRETLAALARTLQLGDYLVLGPGELKSGGYTRASILSDALEAVFGAIYLDGSFQDCRRVILSVFQSALDKASLEATVKDPKTRLQEYLQGRQLGLPEYQLLEISGAAHSQTFRVECSVPELGVVLVGVGKTRRRAEQDAASQVLEWLLDD